MAANDFYSLRWKDFDLNIKETWKDIQNQKEFYDVTLACDDTIVETHKLIISSCSPVLRNILQKSSNQHPFIYLKGVKHEDLINLVNFMYQGEVSIAQDQIDTFLSVAQDLKIKGLSHHEATNFGTEDDCHIERFDDEDYDYTHQNTFLKPLDDGEDENNLINHNKSKNELILTENIQMMTNLYQANMKEPNDTKNPAVNYTELENNFVDNNDFKCDPKTNENAQLMRNHKTMKNPNEEINPVSSLPSYRLNDAGLFSCNLCGKKFGAPGSVNVHIKSVHEGIKYPCNECAYKAPQKSTLKRHMKLVHKEIFYSCNLCEYKTIQTYSLKNHMEEQHAL